MKRTILDHDRRTRQYGWRRVAEATECNAQQCAPFCSWLTCIASHSCPRDCAGVLAGLRRLRVATTNKVCVHKISACARLGANELLSGCEVQHFAVALELSRFPLYPTRAVKCIHRQGLSERVIGVEEQPAAARDRVLDAAITAKHVQHHLRVRCKSIAVQRVSQRVRALGARATASWL